MSQFDCNFLSYTFNRAVSVSVIVPGITSSDVGCKGVSHKIDEKYPVVYLLHGYCNDYSTWSRYTSLERYAEERQIAIVTFSAENGYYLNHEGIVENQTEFVRIMQNNYATFLSKELPEFICSLFPISDKREHTYIAGLSMGGYGAMYHGLKNFDQYRAIGAFSPLTTLKMAPYEKFEELDTKLKEYEPLYLLETLQRSGKDIPALYYSYGAADFLIEVQDWFKKELDQRNIKYTFDYSETHGHEWAFWDDQIKKFLDFIPRDDAYYLACPIRRI